LAERRLAEVDHGDGDGLAAGRFEDAFGQSRVGAARQEHLCAREKQGPWDLEQLGAVGVDTAGRVDQGRWGQTE
jgi:hypothetical protein